MRRMLWPCLGVALLTGALAQRGAAQGLDYSPSSPPDHPVVASGSCGQIWRGSGEWFYAMPPAVRRDLVSNLLIGIHPLMAFVPTEGFAELPCDHPAPAEYHFQILPVPGSKQLTASFFTTLSGWHYDYKEGEPIPAFASPCPYLVAQQFPKCVPCLEPPDVMTNLQRLLQADQLIKRGQELSRAGHFFEAVDCFQEVHRLVPGTNLEARAGAATQELLVRVYGTSTENGVVDEASEPEQVAPTPPPPAVPDQFASQPTSAPVIRQVPRYHGQALTYPDTRQAERNLTRLRIFEASSDDSDKPTVLIKDPNCDCPFKQVLVQVNEGDAGSATRVKPRTNVYPVADLLGKGKETKLDDLEDLIHVIATGVEPNSWAENGGAGTIEYYYRSRAIVVRQTPEVHEQIVDLLAALRRAKAEGEHAQPKTHQAPVAKHAAHASDEEGCCEECCEECCDECCDECCGGCCTAKGCPAKSTATATKPRGCCEKCCPATVLTLPQVCPANGGGEVRGVEIVIEGCTDEPGDFTPPPDGFHLAVGGACADGCAAADAVRLRWQFPVGPVTVLLQYEHRKLTLGLGIAGGDESSAEESESPR